jgi:predicted HAD superfamily Cof-like phosphohydrolase
MTDYDPIAMIEEWDDACDVQPAIELDAFERKKATQLKGELIREEFKELMDEILDAYNGNGDRANLAKELADMLYVVYGAARYFDIPIYDVFEAVHESNMTKVTETGKVERSKSGKILKGPNYVAPDVEALLMNRML